MLNISNANDSIMKGQAKFARFGRKFATRWNAPQVEATKQGIWREMPAEIRENLKAEKPKLYKTMNEKYGGE